MEDKNKDDFQQDFDKFLEEQEELEKEANFFSTIEALTKGSDDIEWSDDNEGIPEFESNNIDFLETKADKLDKFPILRLIPSSKEPKKYEFDGLEHRIFSKINLIAQKIQIDLGDQHTEKTYQNAFAQELNNNYRYFSYFRELRFDILLDDNPVSYLQPDFLILNNDFFRIDNIFLEGFFLELKQNNFEIGRDIVRGSNDNKKDFYEDSYARKQIWKYLRSAFTSTFTPHVSKVRYGVLVNFSGSLMRKNNESLDEQKGAYIEVWKSQFQMNPNMTLPPIKLNRIFSTHKGLIKKEDYQRIYNEYLDKI